MAIVDSTRVVVGGVDTHLDEHVAAVVDSVGGVLGVARFAVSPSGYGRMVSWMRAHGRLERVGVEGTGSYGAGLARHLRAAQVHVIEVNRPDRRQRRTKGKSDPLDAYAAADAVLSGRATALPKAGDGIVESIRALHLAPGNGPAAGHMDHIADNGTGRAVQPMTRPVPLSAI